MFRSPAARIVVAVIAALALLTFLHFHHGQGPMDEQAFHSAPDHGGARQALTVAFVPVTCHLTCPVTDFASKTSTTGTEFDAQRFTEFPTIVEALKSKRIEAAFLTVPLAMKLREQGVPIKICCLGHRDGSALMVRKNDPAKSLRDLKGKTIAIPGPFSNENFFLRTMMQQQGLQPGNIKIVVMSPPDMPTALAANGGIDGFIVAEPFCSKTELDGTGRVLYTASDIWPNYISCALVAHEDLIRDKPDVVHDLVRGIVDSGAWAETHRVDAAQIVAPYFRQDPKLLNYVLTQPGRVSYVNLTPTDAEMQKIEDIGIGLSLLKKRTPMSELMDKRFIPADVVPDKIDVSKAGTVPMVGKS